MTYYIHLLKLPPIDLPPIGQPNFTQSEPELHNLTPVPSETLPPLHTDGCRNPLSTSDVSARADMQTTRGDTRPLLLLGGYSYGAMITSCLPAILNTILDPFQSPVVGSAYAEIRMRAASLATQQSELISVQVSLLRAHHFRGRGLQANDLLSSPTSRKSIGGIRTGGSESMRRASHDSHRSRSSFTIETQERVRKSVDRVRSFTKQSRHRPQRADSDGSWASLKISELGKSNNSLDKISTNDSFVLSSEDNIKPISGIGDSFRTAYLLVSPLQGFVSGLLTLWSFRPNKGLPDPEFKFGVNPTLVLFADDDTFVAAKKLRSWAQRIEAGGTGNFKYREVKDAGHFWHDRGCQIILKDEVRAFVMSL